MSTQLDTYDSNQLFSYHFTEETFKDAVNEQEFAPDAMLAHMSERKPLPPGDLKRLLSQKTRTKGTPDAEETQPTEIEVNGVKHRQVC